ncbi:MAG: hypothetical protein C4576_12890 [Desulfobacteraceae bacterium]|nr:MAG: hypothetical protein C4576_12890 [Desulfobacteraceae bacterium]
MALWPFERAQLNTVSEALEIAEDKTGNHFKLSTVQWKRHRYDVRTLSNLEPSQIVHHAFAFLDRGVRAPDEIGSPRLKREYYFICLQDHRILEALNRDREMRLLPLLVYIFTHELIHIIRFGSFLQRFEISGKDREKEEEVVHGITHQVLKDLTLPRLEHVLDSYRFHRIGEVD